MILILLSAIFSKADTRQQNEKKLYQLMKIDQLIDRSLAAYKSEVVRNYQDINQDDLEKNFYDIFDVAKKGYQISYLKSFSVYTDDEIAKLVDFYNTEFGAWLNNKGNEYNDMVQTNFNYNYIMLNDSFVRRYYKIYQKP